MKLKPWLILLQSEENFNRFHWASGGLIYFLWLWSQFLCLAWALYVKKSRKKLCNYFIHGNCHCTDCAEVASLAQPKRRHRELTCFTELLSSLQSKWLHWCGCSFPERKIWLYFSVCLPRTAEAGTATELHSQPSFQLGCHSSAWIWTSSDRLWSNPQPIARLRKKKQPKPIGSNRNA